ncbi:MAG: cell division protein FtsA [Candidatus Cloacimonetes bacterium HGW-Cloacimonetes-3]|jgi:cell division protein FtsA|nr:MAG: cell division protein FtsA [Candidatus Cloacimonetes bacterium HGW-Cloacimonetes-3]
MKSNIITALDIGSSFVRAIIAKEVGGGRLEILGIGETQSEGIERGIVKDIQALSVTVAKALNDAEKAANTQAQNIHANITGEHIKTHIGDGRISIPTETPNEPGEITLDHVEQVINDAKNSVKIQKGFERFRILHGLPHNFVIDNQDDIHNPVNMSGFHLIAKVYAILSELTPLRNLSKCIELAGYSIDPENFVLNHIALAESILNEDERRLGAIVLDIGGGTCDLAIFSRGSLEKILVIPMAGKNITEDLAIGLKTTIDNAEYIKLEYGNALASSVDQSLELDVDGISGRAGSRKTHYLVSHVIQHRVEEMLSLCYGKAKDFYTPELVTAGIVLCGGTANLTNIDTVLAEAFNLHVKVATPDLSRLNGMISRLEDPAFATVVGILYHACGQEPETSGKSFNLSNLKSSKFTDMFKKILKDFT